jgi:prevent-host-death family protein
MYTKGASMPEVNVRDTRDQLARLLDAVEAGEEIVVTRRGAPVARLVPVDANMTPFPDRSALRASLPPMRDSAVDVVRDLREDRRV